MLKMLRYDLYKLFKSKALLGVFVASVCLSFLDGIFVGLTYGETHFLLRLNAPMALLYLPFVFVVPFACKDFSSKFIKNVFSEYSVRDKICYVLSKLVYIFAINLIWYTLYFLSYYAYVSLQCRIQNVPFVFESVSYDGTVLKSASEGMLSYFCVIVNAFAVETVILFVSILMKKEYFVLIVVILYWSVLSPIIYNALNKAMDLTDTFNRVDWFTVFGLKERLSDTFHIPNGHKIIMAGYTRSLLISLGYSVLFGFLSCLVVASKRTYKVRQTVKEGSTVC